ncbi:MAG TPA: biotin--[acetyl-CoA-carboxylase] ligase [Ktedonobacterales bacterium]|jgi:BirA family biotin operon repressor/biotin-[acetyl-CoA-carboxylase] ligase|nr:biotin--[acetyl-CoA-carboxylase] ligase [Ktedonobacterales bacterium]
MPLDNESTALDIDLIARALAGAPPPFTLRYFPTLDSTNTYAMRLPPGEAREGLVIITDHQIAGRGRVGRVWEGFARQQLTFSVILTPSFAANWLMMASALAVSEAITDVTGLSPAIKWPNDVLIGGKKVCGILIETSGEIAVIGIGVNVNGSLARQPELAARATTLEDEAGQPFAREPLAAAILLALADHYEAMCSQGDAGREAVRMAWRERLVTLGAHVRIDQGQTQVTGFAEDVAEDGALIVRRDDGERVLITWGDVSIGD